MIRRSLLEPSALVGGLLARHDLPPPVVCRVLHVGQNDSYAVEDGAGGRHVLRLYDRRRRSPAEVEGELAMIDALVAGGVAVAGVRADRDGRRVHSIDAPEGPRPAVLFERAPGNLPLAFDEDLARRTGGLLARLHRVLDESALDIDRPALDRRALLERPLAAIERAFPEHRSEVDRIARLAAAAGEVLEALGDVGLCHGDLVHVNLHVDGERLTIFDLDSAGPSWRAYDLAVFGWGLPPSPRRAATWRAFLDGYRAGRPIEGLETARPALEFARQLWVWGLHLEEERDFRAVNPHRLRHELARLEALLEPRPTALVLASRSPRRLELLRSIGLEPEVAVAAVDESPRPGEEPADLVRRLAIAKGRAVGDAGALVLAADTVVIAPDGAILGKPDDDADAVRMLGLLSGRWHRVATGYALVEPSTGRVLAEGCVETRVEFRALDPAEIAAYVASGEPADKAGAYAIQGRAAAFVRRLEGSYTGVVGLPLAEVEAALRSAADGRRPR